MPFVTRSCPRSRASSDFDISPYFMVVKPTLARGFNYKDMHWADLPQGYGVNLALQTAIAGRTRSSIQTVTSGDF